ncbi:MAG: hypothetical protein KIT80_15310 [Chitinophagaceae bacterium]|nr:hypothetical protein [Chitinophagaceae bacterium]MCW5928282.1 hypothetical protein [Chitinophagaceae bacterium]
MDKIEIITAIKKQVEDTVRMHERNLEEIRASIANESKRTAGDKHETALAMLQAEQERTGRHLQQAREQLSGVNHLLLQQGVAADGKGCLVHTDKGLFFLGVAAGRILVNQKHIFAVSVAAPVAKKLLVTPVGASFTLNNQAYKIIFRE